MITDKILEDVFTPTYENMLSMQNIAGASFNKYFKDIKWIMKGNVSSDTVDDMKVIFDDLDKRDIIIFSPNKEKLDAMNKVNSKIIFPFDKVFLEYPMAHQVIRKEFGDVIIKITNGFYLKTVKDNNGNIKGIALVTLWLDYGANKSNPYEEGLNPQSFMIPYDHFSKKLIITDDITEEQRITVEDVVSLMKKICYLVQKKEYGEYYKWTPSGVVGKDIVHSHDVKSHKRHFWKDSGKFKIASMNKDEIISRGYGIDECVFRGYELRRDVPYLIIGSYKVGESTKIKKAENRVVHILKKRIFKNEERLGIILSKIFPNEIIKRHDRRRIKPLELDFYIHKLNLAFEYDGEQHYDRKVCEEVFKSDFDAQRGRDIKKNAMCRHKKIKLIRVKYSEPLTIANIKRIIKSTSPNILS